MKVRALIVGAVVALQAASASAGIDAVTAKRIREARDLKELVGVMRDIERMSAAALAATDVTEFKSQRTNVTLLLGKISGVPARSTEARALCVGAAGTLDLLLAEMEATPAQAKLAAERNVVQWRKDMAQCERAVGIKGARAL